MNFVIGSGPAGVACAMALVSRGLPVTMLDAGRTLEPERRQAVERLRAMDPSKWHGEAAAFLRHNAVPDRRGIGTKHIFGSDYPYRDADRLFAIEKDGCDTTASLAVGGFSAVWGATILPYLPSDTADWPFTSVPAELRIPSRSHV